MLRVDSLFAAILHSNSRYGYGEPRRLRRQSIHHLDAVSISVNRKVNSGSFAHIALSTTGRASHFLMAHTFLAIKHVS